MQAHLKEQYDYLKQHVFLKQDPHCLNAREAALAYFLEKGLPTTRDEAFRYTDVSRLSKTQYAIATPSDTLNPEIILQYCVDRDNPRLVFINGYYSLTHSKPLLDRAQIDIFSLCALDEKDRDEFLNAQQIHEGISAINSALYQEGFFIRVKKNVQIQQPIELIFIHTAENSTMQHIKHFIRVEEGSEATIIEQHYALNDSDYLKTMMTDIRLSQNSKLHYYKHQLENQQAFHFNQMTVEQAKDSAFCFMSTDFGGKLVRNDVTVRLLSTNAQCELNGLYIAKQKQHIDNHTIIHHEAPCSTSAEVFKGIIDDKARAVFNGCVVVHEGAYQTEAKQHNANLLLSNDAEIDTKPQLEIYHDDVKCAHGATVGQLDDDAIFYLRSRGISEADAKQLLTFGFAESLIAFIHNEPLREKIQNAVLDKLNKRSMLEGVS